MKFHRGKLRRITGVQSCKQPGLYHYLDGTLSQLARHELIFDGTP